MNSAINFFLRSFLSQVMVKAFDELLWFYVTSIEKKSKLNVI